MARPTKCPHCKETTYHRQDVEHGRLCNLCDKPKPIRAATTARKAKIAARVALGERLLA